MYQPTSLAFLLLVLMPIRPSSYGPALISSILHPSFLFAWERHGVPGNDAAKGDLHRHYQNLILLFALSLTSLKVLVDETPPDASLASELSTAMVILSARFATVCTPVIYPIVRHSHL